MTDDTSEAGPDMTVLYLAEEKRRSTPQPPAGTPPNGTPQDAFAAGLLALGSAHSMVRLFEATVTHQMNAQQIDLATTTKCIVSILNDTRRQTLEEDLLTEQQSFRSK